MFPILESNSGFEVLQLANKHLLLKMTLQISTSLSKLINRNIPYFLLFTSVRCTYDIRYLYPRYDPEVKMLL